MDLRADALCAAAEFVLAVEAYARNCAGLVATVGRLSALPGSSNVIPGEVSLSLDIRHTDDAVRGTACAKLQDLATSIGKKRGIKITDSVVQEAGTVVCDRHLTETLEHAVSRHQSKSLSLAGGAGHDAAAMAAITPVAMLFVRCKGGISHHPEESASLEDVRVVIDVTNDFLKLFAQRY